ncbi:terpene synthase family protein [Streptomyces sp. NPDC060000]|uniref:terpene synthase family protein n=1 Tax=Streptomyces sp. NPDC060000 TaxID=3347031 RepID=UPI0036B48539
MCLSPSLGERAADITVPAAAFPAPRLRVMRQTAIDVTLMCNDVYSLEKEEARGDMDNLVLVLEHSRHLTRAEAVTAAGRRVTATPGGSGNWPHRYPPGAAGSDSATTNRPPWTPTSRSWPRC